MDRSKSKAWELLTKEEVIHELHSHEKRGLSEHAVTDNRIRYGDNAVVEKEHGGFMRRLKRQLANPLVFMLVIAFAFTVGLQHYVDAAVIALAIIVNLIIGLVQEGRADQSFSLLRKSEEKFAVVMRDGAKRRLAAHEVVVGDIMLLEAGIKVVADARLIDAHGLHVNESPLTGEWVEVEKHAAELPTLVPLAEQKNMVFAGTLVTSGLGKAVVVRTGIRTEIGHIGEMLRTSEAPLTPLEESVRSLAGYVAMAVGLALVLIFILGLIQGEAITTMIFIAVAIAVAAIPEGMPAAVTVVLAIGMESVLRRGGLVRSLLAAETLGSTTVILTDKTGTLTKGEMRVGRLVTLSSIRAQKGHASSLHPTPETHDGDRADLQMMAMLASDAFVEKSSPETLEVRVHGRPVERAIIMSGLESGLHPDELFRDFPRVDFIPFQSKYRFAASLHSVAHSPAHYVYLSGAPEILLQASHFAHHEGKHVALSKELVHELTRAHEHYTKEGMRLTGIGYIEGSAKLFNDDVRKDPSLLLRKKIVFVGFIALHDPMREEAKDSVALAQRAGTRVIMVTGDHPDTARAVAHASGIAHKEAEPVYTGTDIDKLTDAELLQILKTGSVFARMLPEHKLRLERVLQGAGEIVAMTGDGINDAPALRGANIGIAVGSGTEVAKEASDLVLLNNSFAVIVSAIEEGRRMMDNLRKIIAYLLSTSFGEIVLFAGALTMGLPIPLLPAQMIWTNMVTEGLMNFAFAFEPAEPDVMKRNPKSLAMRTILPPEVRKFIWAVGVGTGLILFGLFVYLSRFALPIEELRTLMFIAVSGISLSVTFSVKDLRNAIWHSQIFTNKYLWWSLIVSTLGIAVALYIPQLAALLGLVAMPMSLTLGIVFIAVFLNVAMMELLKWLFIERRLAR